MSSLRPELHVAQQIRREKLRIQNNSNTSATTSQNLQDFPNNLDQLSLHQGLNFDLLQVRSLRNASNMLDDEPQPQSLYSLESSAEPTSRLMLMPHNNNTNNQYGSHDWMVMNYPTSSVANQSNNNHPHHCFLANELNSSNNVSAHNYVKPSCNNVLTDGEMHYPNPSSSNSSLYQNALQDIFNKASSNSISGHGSEMASLMHQAAHHGTWGGNSNDSEHVLHQNYGGGGGSSSANLWINRGVDNNTFRWNSPLGFTEKKVNDSSNPHQGLSLSLSSNSQSKPCNGKGSSSNDPQSADNNISKEREYVAKFVKASNIVSRDCTGKSLQVQDTVVLPPNTGYRNVGPLGPFTGYATILKSSRFLKPCQQLLDEYCCKNGSKSDHKACDDVPEWVSRDVSASSSVADAVSMDESGVAGKGSNAGSSSSMFCGSSKDNSNDGGAARNFCLSSRPECQKNKAKLLYMQEEVTRRYKQYHQQMQMVVSSFESVAGLNSATPYISLALKSVSRHFRSLKNAILDQLKLICEALGEDLLSIPMTSPSSKFDTNMARLRCMDQSFQRNKSSGDNNIDFIEPQHHVWRPQRGLPERSVAILKAWLFEHFLHPYPTDTDKHMLATQTGLSRNQVSNWFINARVRVWKPMVEEIHMLETKGGVGGANQSSNKNEGASASEGSSSHPRADQPLSMFGTHATNAMPERKFQCLEMGSSSLASANDEQWNQEKRSKLECQVTSGMDHGTLMGFMPFRHHGARGALEVGGLGPVSLTLGLRHGVEGAQQQHQQQQQQQLQHEEQLRRHFGGHMIHDFVG